MIKIILKSVTATLIVVAFAASMFLNSILGVFGLASTSIENLSRLQQTKQIVDTLKAKHKIRKLKVSKRLANRSSKRIAASAVSAATIGTVAVVTVMATIEIIEYCDDKKELFEEENILFNTNQEFNYGECLKEAKSDVDEIITSIKKAAPKAVSSTWHDTKDISMDSWNTTKNMTKDTWKATKSISGSAWNYTKVISSDAWNSTSEAAESVWDSLINPTK